MMGMKEKPFQFTLRQILLATVFIACACAIAGWLFRMLTNLPITDAEFGGKAILSFMAIGGFSGAAVGVISGPWPKWVCWGIVIGLAAAFAFDYWTMLYVVFLTVFVAFGLRWVSTKCSVGPAVTLTLLGAAIQGLSFAVVNYVLSVCTSGEGKGWFEFFASAGSILSALLFSLFLLSFFLTRVSFSIRLLSIFSAAFLLFMTVWTWWISHFPDHNWW